MKERWPWVLFLLLSLMGAGEPLELGRDPAGYARAMGQGKAITISASTTPACVTTTPGGAVCALCPARAVVPVEVDGAAMACWSQRPITAVGTWASTSRTQITTALGTDACTGHVFAAAGAKHDMGWSPSTLLLSPNVSRTAYCSNPSRSGFGAVFPVYRPCTTDADCSGVSEGACIRTNPTDAGAFLYLAAPSATLVTTHWEQ